MKEGMADLCEKLSSTALENEEICLDVHAMDEVLRIGKNYLLVKLLSKKYLIERLSKQQCKGCGNQSIWSSSTRWVMELCWLSLKTRAIKEEWLPMDLGT